MKVLLIDVNCKNSSTGNIVYNLYNYINSSGDEAAVCYGRGPKIEEKNIFKFGIDAETYLHALLTRITGFTGCYSFFSTRRLIKFIKEFNPDVVHIHELHAYFVNIKPLINYLKKNHIKTVMTLHCEFAYTGKCGHSVECEQWKTECKKCPHLKNYVSTLWFDHTNYMFRQKKELFCNFKELQIVTPSSWIASRAQESFLKEHPIKVINNGIDTNLFLPVDSSDIRTKHAIRLDEKIVLALAPNIMSKEKGGQYVKIIAEKLSQENIRFIFVGTDNDDIVKEDNCIYVGKIRDKSILAKYYSMADLFVICSERENFPTTCLEAQSCGTPVFGFDTGGVSETCLVKDNLVEYGNTIELANKIKYADNKNKNSCLQLANKAKEAFGNTVFLAKYREIYRSMMNND